MFWHQINRNLRQHTTKTQEMKVMMQDNALNITKFWQIIWCKFTKNKQTKKSFLRPFKALNLIIWFKKSWCFLMTCRLPVKTRNAKQSEASESAPTKIRRIWWGRWASVLLWRLNDESHSLSGGRADGVKRGSLIWGCLKLHPSHYPSVPLLSQPWQGVAAEQGWY